MTWRRELQRTADCIPIERFAEQLTAAERAHVDRCARCEAELALWQEFASNEPAGDEGAAVQWMVAEIRRHLEQTAPVGRRTPRAWLSTFRPRTLALAATVALAAAIGYIVSDRREPSVGVSAPGAAIYRSTAVRALEPAGDLDAPPGELRWESVSGTARYDVELREVDGTVVWRGSASAARASLPDNVRSQLAPGRAFLWRVTARTADGAILAESATERFRVLVKPDPRNKP